MCNQAVCDQLCSCSGQAWETSLGNLAAVLGMASTSSVLPADGSRLAHGYEQGQPVPQQVKTNPPVARSSLFLSLSL